MLGEALRDRSIYVQLHRSEGIVSRLIKWQSRGPYAHASLLFDDGTVYESVAGDGVRKVHVATYEERYRKGWIHTAEVHLTVAEEALVRGFLESQLGKPYDYFGVFQFVTRGKQGGNATARWFCAELVYAAFEAMNAKLLNNTEAWEVSPTLLSRTPFLQFES